MLREEVLLRENMEDFSKDGPMLSIPASQWAEGLFHSPLRSFSISPISPRLTGRTAGCSRHSLLRPEHLQHINKVRWQKIQIHRSFLMEKGKKSL